MHALSLGRYLAPAPLNQLPHCPDELPAGKTSLWLAPPARRFVMHVRRGQFHALEARLDQEFGLTLVDAAKVSRADTWSAAGRGPGVWMLRLAATSPPTLADDIKQAINGLATLVDVTDGWVAVTLAGPEAKATLSQFLRIDLHPEAFGVDSFAATELDGLSVLVWHEAQDRYELAVSRSFAASFLTSLKRAHGGL